MPCRTAPSRFWEIACICCPCLVPFINQIVTPSRTAPMIKVITFCRLRDTGPALKRPGAKAGMALVDVPPSMLTVV